MLACIPHIFGDMPSRKELEAWRTARVEHYIQTRSHTGLAHMLVDLENATNSTPEFDINEDWPASVRHLKVK